MHSVTARYRLTSLLLAAAGASLIGVASASAATFSNPTPINMPAAGPTNGTPYPSPVAVAGLFGTVTDVNVTLRGVSHTYPEEFGAVLVSPGGQAFKALDGPGDATDVTDVTWVLDDSAAAFLPTSGALASGTFKPTSYYNNAFSFPAPGPGAAYAWGGPTVSGTATFASVFNGTLPNGTWNLFVRDFFNMSGGQFAGGWSLDLATNGSPPAAPSKKCKKKKRKGKKGASAAKRCKKKKKRK